MPILKVNSEKPKFKEELPELRDYNKLFPPEYDFALIIPSAGIYFKDYERKSHYYEIQCKSRGHLLPILCNCEFAKIMRLSQIGLEVMTLTNEELGEIFGTRT